jgi:hypothetical protein
MEENMNVSTKTMFLIVALGLASALNGNSQGTFQNLDFEAAQLIPIPGDPDGAVLFSAAFPAWTGYIDGQVQTRTIPGNLPLSTPFPFISIMTLGYQGHYSVGFGTAYDSSGNVIPVALAQTGQVPSDAKSLQFLGRYASAISLSLGGQPLSVVPLNDNQTGGRLYGADVAGYAGRLLELRFQPGPGIDLLDDIRFSDQPIPEPSAFGLFGLGALLLGWRFLLKRK